MAVIGLRCLATTDTTYTLTVPYHASEALQFRVSSVAYENVTALSPIRTIVVPALTIDAGGESVWYVGQERWIRWSRNAAPGEVNLDVNYGDRAKETGRTSRRPCRLFLAGNS